MSFLTASRLAQLVRTSDSVGFQATLSEARNMSASARRTTVFLSHKHSDRDLAMQIVAMFHRLGVGVYVDWLDSSMSPFTDASTAHKLKEKIKENRKFILLATNGAVDSKWCNWELGFGDAHKYPIHQALIPLADNAGHWSGQEYLRIYPRIEELAASYSTPAGFYVVYPDNKQVPLLQWLLA